jgi:hypothetical protein
VERIPRTQTELSAIERLLDEATGTRRTRLEARRSALRGRLADWAGKPAGTERELRGMRKGVRDALRSELARIAEDAINASRRELYAAKIETLLGRRINVDTVDATALPALLFLPSVNGLPNNEKYLKRLLAERLTGQPHDWLWTEPKVAAWRAKVAAAQPRVNFDRWRRPFKRAYDYRPGDAASEKAKRIKADLAQTRRLLEDLGASSLKDDSPETLRTSLAALLAPPQPKDGEKIPPPPDPTIVEEIRINLERIDLLSRIPESDYQGRLTLEVESDPFQILYMGEYGFASCLSLRGQNTWGAVSNAIDVDKTIVWARESGANVVGRRLIALTPDGLLSYRTYANRNGFTLDAMFKRFLEEYADHCGTRVTHHGRPDSLLSDRWYDDGSI